MCYNSEHDIYDLVGRDAPNAIIEVTRKPLSNDIPRLVSLSKSLVAVYIRDISQRLFLNCEPQTQYAISYFNIQVNTPLRRR